MARYDGHETSTAPRRPEALSPADEVRAADVDFADYQAPLRAKTDAELRAASFVFRTIQSPGLMRVGTWLARAGLKLHVPGTVRAIESTVFRQFCGGSSLDEAAETARRLYQQGRIGTILDYAAEGEDSERGSDQTRNRLIDTIDRAGVTPPVAFCATKLTGMARFELLEKASTDEPLDDAEQAELDRVVERLESVVQRARQVGIGQFVDAEHSWIQPAIDRIVEDRMREHNRDGAVVHTTVQLYLRDRLEYLRRLVEDARTRGYVLGVKLVRGAYLEQENERAAERGHDTPVQPSKQATDEAFDRAITLCLENLDCVAVCAATHNTDSLRHLMSEMERLGIRRGAPRVTVSQLLGMLDRVTLPLAESGYNALKYVPFGAVREAFPYLLRRADENKSIAEQTVDELEAIRAELARRGRRSL